jgi:OOP family OmpA-OmpF porin
MKRIAALVLASLFAALTTGIASAGAPEGSWYIAPEVYALWLDDARQADDDAGLALSLGRTLNPNWDLELGFFGSQHGRATGEDLQLQGLGITAKRVFYREGRVNPYLSFGLAHVNAIIHQGPNDEDLAALYGVGLLIDVGGSRDDGTAMQVRADLGARRGLSDSGGVIHPVDYVAGLGIQYNWGGSPARKFVDADGDGVSDDLDKCPGTPAGTSVDSTGCPLDDDGDGVTNDLDKCPGTPAGSRVDANGCPPDSDGDGVADSLDQCPNTPAGTKVDDKGCELDGDADGILDSQDKCPDTPKGERVDATGCPFNKELQLQGVKFATNSADLLPESLPVLERAIATLKRYPELNIEVVGHTDDRGSDAYNQQLSGRRAETVLKYLRDGGLTNMLSSRGYGERQPIASNDTDEGRQQNRRVVLRVLN